MDGSFDNDSRGITISAKWWSIVQLELYSKRNFFEDDIASCSAVISLFARASDPIKLLSEQLDMQITDPEELELTTEWFIESGYISCFSKNFCADLYCIWAKFFLSEVEILSIVILMI